MNTTGRLFTIICLLIVLVATVQGQPTTVTVTDTLYSPSGGLLSGTVNIRANGTCAAPPVPNLVIGGSPNQVRVGTDGVFTTTLVPNDTCTPQTSYYVTYNLVNSSGAPQPRFTETWYVPSSPSTTTIQAVRTAVIPASITTIGFTQLTGATLGDILYGNGSGGFSRLAGNITTTRKFVGQTGTGSVSAAPAWLTLVDGAFTTDDCLKVNAAGNVVSAGAACNSGGGGGGGGITSLNALTGAVQTFANDTNITMTSVGTTHTLGWTSTLSGARGGLGANASAFSGVLKMTTGVAAVVTGTATDCVLVDGTSGPCGATVGNSGTTFTSQTSVSVTHPDTVYPLVNCWDAGSPPRRIVPHKTERTSNTEITVTFLTAQSGNCAVNTSGGGGGGGGGGAISSVFGRTGTVVANTGDYTAAQVTNAFNLASNNDLGANYFDISSRAVPSSPSSGKARIFFSTVDNRLTCLDSTGASCMPSGGTGTPGGSSGQVQINSSGAFGGVTVSTGLQNSGGNLGVNTSTVAPMPLFGQAVYDFTSIAANTCATTTITVTGADPGDAAYVKIPQSFPSGLTVTAKINTTNTATLELCNVTASPIDPASFTYGVMVQQITWVATTIYNVGPGMAYTTIASVPWDSLTPGSEVRIHWKAAAYQEKWHIGRSGRYNAPIRVIGVRGPLGQRPVIDGSNASAKPGQSYWNEDRGVIKIGGPSIGTTYVEHVIVEGLEIRNGRLGNNFLPLSGGPYPYSDNAAGVYIEGPARYLVVRDCYFTNNGLGIFASTNLEWLLIEGNHLYNNGYSGSSQQHNSYIEGLGITYQFNRYEFDDGWEGNNLKDRSAFVVIRYNQLIGGNRTMDLVNGPAQTTYNFPLDEVYGNLLVKGRGYNNNQIVHYGYDTGSTHGRRNLRFYHNTIINKRMSPGENQFVGFKLDVAAGTNYAYNNVFWAYTPGQPNSYYGGDLVEGPGTMTWVTNWIYQGDCTNPAIYCTRAGGGFIDGGGNTWAGSADPYISAADGTITSASSPLIGAATPTITSWRPVRHQYGSVGSRTRPSTDDLGMDEW